MGLWALGLGKQGLMVLGFRVYLGFLALTLGQTLARSAAILVYLGLDLRFVLEFRLS